MSGNHNSGPPRGLNLVKATDAWGEAMPDWVRLLANACDRTSQRAAAERLARSSGYVSRLLSRKYEGSYEEAETIVRAAYAGASVACPAIGDAIPLSGCVRNRRRAGPPRNHLQQLFARHCPRCPLNTDKPTHDMTGDAR